MADHLGAPSPLDELFDAEETGETPGRIWMSLTGFARLRRATASRTAWRRALPLDRVLRMRVRLLGWTVRLSVMGTAAVVVASLALSSLWTLLASWVHPTRAAAAPTPPISASTSPASVVEISELSNAQRAALGDDLAMKTLAKRDRKDLSPDELLSLVEGRRIHRQQELGDTAERLVVAPEVLREEAVTHRLSQDLDDPDLSIEVLRALSHVAAPIGPDMLFAIRDDRSRDATTRWLAGALLRTREVQRHVSEPLAVALELEEVADCMRAAELVALAMEYGDRRSLSGIKRLTEMSGCEPEGSVDCFPCLRGGTELQEALEAVGDRRPPSLPAVARPIGSAGVADADPGKPFRGSRSTQHGARPTTNQSPDPEVSGRSDSDSAVAIGAESPASSASARDSAAAPPNTRSPSPPRTPSTAAQDPGF